SKAIQTQHDTAMAQVESILFQVRKHYEDEDREAQALGPVQTADAADVVATDTAAAVTASTSEVAA
ncbi:MAG: hypothetical protein WBH52_08460, partial [Pseudomonas aeruginosa]